MPRKSYVRDLGGTPRKRNLVESTDTASDTAAGIVELATNAETITGTDATRAVTPAGLSARVATETGTGIVELATNAEAVTGTDTARAVTPANLTARLAVPGPIGGTTPAAGAFTTLSASGLISANGGQIAFPATQNASANANTLDDYEEGTWTPADASGAGLTLVGAVGLYTKIGNMVFASAELTYPVTVNGANSKIGGLPFASNSGSGAVRQGSLTYSNSAGNANKILLGAAGSTDFQFYTAAGVAVTNAGMSASANWVQCIYPV